LFPARPMVRRPTQGPGKVRLHTAVRWHSCSDLPSERPAGARALTAARMRKITSTQGERHFAVDMLAVRFVEWLAVPSSVVRIRQVFGYCDCIAPASDQSNRHACPSHGRPTGTAIIEFSRDTAGAVLALAERGSLEEGIEYCTKSIPSVA
jgi:hypothetical protein